MAQIHQEHVLLRRCICGYESKEVSGETKYAYSQARGSIRFIGRFE